MINTVLDLYTWLADTNGNKRRIRAHYISNPVMMPQMPVGTEIGIGTWNDAYLVTGSYRYRPDLKLFKLEVRLVYDHFTQVDFEQMLTQFWDYGICFRKYDYESGDT